MVEGQDGLNWPRWRHIASAVEEAGFAALYRSDHFVAHDGPRRDALELWASLTWLASNTRRIEFGPLVTPTTLRNPVVTALTAAAVDDLSGGRLRLGLGAGWQEREHRAFGFDLPPLSERFDRFDEALAVVSLLLRSDGPASFRGKFYRLDDAFLTPRPSRHVPIVVGGRGMRRTLPLVARYADEWNATGLAPGQHRELNQRLDDILLTMRRDPATVRRSVVTWAVTGHDENDVRRRLAGRDPVDLRAQGVLVGTADQLPDQLAPWAKAGVSRVILPWEDLDDADGLRAFGKALTGGF
jgi:F420-dependent oxidoreductase-like protein